MREILFRAKREATNEWVYGYFVKEYDDFQIYVNSKIITKSGHEYVREDTLGQFTGLTDKNGVKIFEGDIVEILLSGKHGIGIVEYGKSGISAYVAMSHSVYSNYVLDRSDNFIVLGNIYDNPELIGGSENGNFIADRC